MILPAPALTRTIERRRAPTFDALLPPFAAGRTMSARVRAGDRSEAERTADLLEQMAAHVREHGLPALIDAPGADQLWQGIAHVLTGLSRRPRI